MNYVTTTREFELSSPVRFRDPFGLSAKNHFAACKNVTPWEKCVACCADARDQTYQDIDQWEHDAKYNAIKTWLAGDKDVIRALAGKAGLSYTKVTNMVSEAGKAYLKAAMSAAEATSAGFAELLQGMESVAWIYQLARANLGPAFAEIEKKANDMRDKAEKDYQKCVEECARRCAKPEEPGAWQNFWLWVVSITNGSEPDRHPQSEKLVNDHVWKGQMRVGAPAARDGLRGLARQFD